MKLAAAILLPIVSTSAFHAAVPRANANKVQLSMSTTLADEVVTAEEFTPTPKSYLDDGFVFGENCSCRWARFKNDGQGIFAPTTFDGTYAATFREAPRKPRRKAADESDRDIILDCCCSQYN